MIFVIYGKKYDTDKMEKVAEVKKWYRDDSLFLQSLCGNAEVGRIRYCELWKTRKGNWLLTHKENQTICGEAIGEEEAKGLLMKHDFRAYEKMYGEIPEA